MDFSKYDFIVYWGLAYDIDASTIITCFNVYISVCSGLLWDLRLALALAEKFPCQCPYKLPTIHWNALFLSHPFRKPRACLVSNPACGINRQAIWKRALVDGHLQSSLLTYAWGAYPRTLFQDNNRCFPSILHSLIWVLTGKLKLVFDLCVFLQKVCLSIVILLGDLPQNQCTL